MTIYYHRTLSHSSSITHSVLGNFLDEKKEDIIVSNGRILKLLRFEPDKKDIQTLITEDIYDNICSLSKFRRKDIAKDWFVFTTDSGQVTVLAADAEKMAFKLLLQEDFQAKIPSTLPVHHLSVDSHGRAVSIAAVQWVKQLWFFTDPGNDKLMDILDVSEENVLIYDTAFVDVNSENPVIAYLATGYEDLHPGVKYELRERPKPSLVFCEGNKDKWTEIKRIKCLNYANSLIPVPGEKGVLVCAEDFIAFYSMDSSDIIRCSIPKRIMEPKRGVIFVCSTKCIEKNSFYYLAQTEQGDIFKIQLVSNDSGVNEIILKYFITLPVASALCALESGFLFVASEFGDHHFFKISDIESRARCQPSFSSALPQDKRFFFMHRTVDIAPAAEIKSLSPIMQMDIVTLPSNRHQMCLATGRASSSALKVSTLQQDVTYLYRVKIDKEPDETPMRMWAIESTESTSTKPETLIVVSFEDSTAVYSLEKADKYEIKKLDGTLFATNISTIGCTKTGEDAIVQICPAGICLIRERENQLIRKYEKENAVENYAINKKSLIVALRNKEMMHHEIDKDGRVMKTKIPRRFLDGPVTCMLLCDSSKSDQLLAVGISIPASSKTESSENISTPASSGSESSVEISVPASSETKSSVKSSASVNAVYLFIVSVSEIQLLYTLNMENSPYSFLFMNSETQQDLLLVGCEDGTVLTSTIEKIYQQTKKTKPPTNSALTVIRSEKIGSAAVQLLYVPVGDIHCILAISDHSYVKESAQGDFIQLKSHLTHCICILPERLGLAIGIGTILEYSFRIFSLDDLQFKPPVTIPLEYTPKKLVVDSPTRHAFILETDDKSYTEDTREKKINEFKQHVAQRQQPASNLPSVENIPKSWASIFQIIDFSVENAKEVFKFSLGQNEAALSFCRLEAAGDNIFLVGVAQNFNQSTACCTEASVYTFKIESGNYILLHRTLLNSAPLAMCSYEEFVFIGSGRKLLLCVFDHTLQLNLVCEKKECVANGITAIYPAGDRILVSDSKFGISCLVYNSADYILHLIDKDVGSDELTAACLLNEEQMVRASKSRDIFIVALGALKTRELSTVYNKDGVPFTLSKEKLLACFHVGEVVTSLQMLNTFPNEPNAVLYTTLSGSIGVLTPLPWDEDAKFLNCLNTAMLKTSKVIDKKRFNLKLSQHFQFRSRHFKCENVIDGDFLDQFLKLEKEHQITIARQMEIEVIAQNVIDGDFPDQSPNLEEEHQTTISTEDNGYIAKISAALANIRRETMLDFQF